MPLPRRDYDRTVNPEIERLLYQEKVILQEAEGLYHGLSDDQINWQPRPGSWSIGQCLEHLNISNQRLIGKIESALNAAKTAGKRHDGPYVYGFFSRWMLRTIQPPGKSKLRTQSDFEPAEKTTWLLKWSGGVASSAGVGGSPFTRGRVVRQPTRYQGP